MRDFLVAEWDRYIQDVRDCHVLFKAICGFYKTLAFHILKTLVIEETGFYNHARQIWSQISIIRDRTVDLCNKFIVDQSEHQKCKC